MTILYQRETFDAFYKEALPLLEKHKSEIAQYPDIPLDVDGDRYRQLEQAGALRIFTARMPLRVPLFGPALMGSVEVTKLIGYAVFLVGPNPHYKTSLQAMQDVIYVDTDHRGTRAGIGLIRFSEASLRNEGVQVVSHHVKLAHPMLGRLLDKEGYVVIEAIYAKRLDR